MRYCEEPESNALQFSQNPTSQARQPTHAHAPNYRQNTNYAPGQQQSNASVPTGGYSLPLNEDWDDPDLFQQHTEGNYNSGISTGALTPIQPVPSQRYSEHWFLLLTTFTGEDIIPDTQEKADEQAKAALEKQFPRLRPKKWWHCQQIINESFKLHSGLFGTNPRKTLPQHMERVVIAHVRHKTHKLK